MVHIGQSTRPAIIVLGLRPLIVVAAVVGAVVTSHVASIHELPTPPEPSLRSVGSEAQAVCGRRNQPIVGEVSERPE